VRLQSANLIVTGRTGRYEASDLQGYKSGGDYRVGKNTLPYMTSVFAQCDRLRAIKDASVCVGAKAGGRKKGKHVWYQGTKNY
jgi:hypothetical protein